ncbi:MAG TPA: hypothetical protein VIT23_04175, partial [Terrimicrobiaceae bacterium]
NTVGPNESRVSGVGGGGRQPGGRTGCAVQGVGAYLAGTSIADGIEISLNRCRSFSCAQSV